MSNETQEPTTRATENRLRLRACGTLCLVEVVIYSLLGILLAVAAMVALSGAGKLLWDGIGTWASTATVLPVIDRLLVALMLVEILHTVRISIRSHSLVTEPFLVVGLIASIRRMLVITLDASNLMRPEIWNTTGESMLRASMLELGLLGFIVLVLVFSVYLLRRQQARNLEE